MISSENEWLPETRELRLLITSILPDRRATRKKNKKIFWKFGDMCYIAIRREKLEMNRILLGNLISFLGSLALTAGCLMKDPKKVYGMQVTENLISGNVISWMVIDIIRTGQGFLSMTIPSRAISYSFFPPTFLAEYIGGIWL